MLQYLHAYNCYYTVITLLILQYTLSQHTITAAKVGERSNREKVTMRLLIAYFF